MSSLPAGWYKDPADTSTQRYWDGEGWLGQAIPADAVPPDGPPAVEAEPAAATPEPAPPVPQPYAASPTSAPPQAAAPQSAPPAYGPPPGWGQPPQGQPPQGQPGWGQPPQGQPGWGQQQPGQPWGQPPQGQPGWGQQQPGQPGWGQPTWAGQPPHAYLYPMPQAMPHGLPLAGLGRRLTARLIDIAVVLLLNLVVNGWFLYQYWQDFYPIFQDYMAQIEAGSTEALVAEPTSRMQTLSIAIVLVATLLWLLYEAPSISSRGQTLGKRAMGIKVVPIESTAPLGFGRAFTRWARLGMWTLFWWCGVGLVIQFLASLSPLFDSRLRQAWHDKAAATVVVALPPGTHPTAPAAPGGNLPGGPR
ncbi:RDD family protein [Actinoplanes sp. DH11]|uniref:RDD family protein n=1 Tax=Actinoplanes sp. DH11 TaxID=2857011 RepID=UPI001E584F35|nr:RDD family protein [Actinoplanes sp. DH11]